MTIPKRRKTLQQLLFQQQMLAILLFTLLVLVIWIGSSIYFTFSKSTITSEEKIFIEPLDPTINTKSIDFILQRKWWKPEELTNFTILSEKEGSSGFTSSLVVNTPQGSPVSTASATPIASTSAQPSATP